MAIGGRGSNSGVGFGSSSSTGSVSYSTAFQSQPVDLRCKAMGHRVVEGSALLQYVDGVIVAFCEVCGDRVELAEVPAGNLKALVEDLITQLAATEDFSMELVGCLLGTEERVMKYWEELDQLTASLRLALEIVKQRWPAE